MLPSALLRVKLGPRLSAAVVAAPHHAPAPIAGPSAPSASSQKSLRADEAPRHLQQSGAILSFMFGGGGRGSFDAGGGFASVVRRPPAAVPPKSVIPINSSNDRADAPRYVRTKPLRIAISRTRAAGQIVVTTTRLREGTCSTTPSPPPASLVESSPLPQSFSRSALSAPTAFRNAPPRQITIGSAAAIVEETLRQRAFGPLGDTMASAEATSSSSSKRRLLAQTFPASRYVGLVACAVSSVPLALPSASSSSGRMNASISGASSLKASTEECLAGDFSIGVNFAVHRLVNAKAASTSAAPRRQQQQQQQQQPPPLLISGLLKGCAEQNALGAFAARGLEPFTAIRTVVLFGRHVATGGDSESTSDSDAKKGGEPCACCSTSFPVGELSDDAPMRREEAAWWLSMFPCGQCWAHLRSIWAEQKHQLNCDLSTAATTGGGFESATADTRLKLVISVESMAEVDLLRRALRPCSNSASDDDLTYSQEAGGAHTSTTSLTIDARIEWFRKRHSHLIAALSRRGGGGGRGGGGSLATLVASPHGAVAPLIAVTERLEDASEACKNSDEDDLGPQIILLVANKASDM